MPDVSGVMDVDKVIVVPTGKLPPGTFTLAAQIVVNANAMNAEIRRVPIDVASKP